MASMKKAPSQEEIANTLGNLEISTSHPQKTAQKPKSKPVADSWDLDDDAQSGSDTETEQVTTLKNKADSPHEALEPISTIDSRDLPPNPPPPTPASPTQFEYPDTTAPYSLSSEGPRSRGVGGGSLDKRPEKTTAVAGRLIAGALGVRAPKRTDEEREYDRVMRDKERKRRAEQKEREKREAEAREARKKAVWDD